MIAFASIALLLLVIAVAIVLWPLLRRLNVPAFGRELSNLDIHRDQFAELRQNATRRTRTNNDVIEFFHVFLLKMDNLASNTEG